MILLLVLVSSVQANKNIPLFDRSITGVVVNDKGEPVSDASVTVKGTTSGTVTDRSGAFKLTVPDGQVILTISNVGFVLQEITVTGKHQQGFRSPAYGMIIPLSEVVVTALGISKQKKSLGFSVTEVKGEELAKTNEINPINALQGKVAGVQIDMGGASGLFGNSKILIRGNSTLRNNNQPIIVMDGVIIANDILSGTRDFGNDLKNLNMEDFESVSVLKGSSAAALYGSRAINGVILITSKKGKSRKGLGITVTQSVEVQDLTGGRISE